MSIETWLNPAPVKVKNIPAPRKGPSGLTLCPRQPLIQFLSPWIIFVYGHVLHHDVLINEGLQMWP